MIRPLANLIIITCLSLSLSLQAAEPAIGSVAPDLGATSSFNTLDKGPVTLESLRGQVVLIDFWATWCHPCCEAIPHVEELYEKYKDQGLVVIGHTDASSKDLANFIPKNKITYIISVGANIGDAYGVTGIPHVFLIDPDGKIAWSGHPSGLQESTITALLKKAHPPGPAAPRFATPSTQPKVAALEKEAASGKVGSALKGLEKLAADGSKVDVATAATAATTTIAAWRTTMEQQIARQQTEGDLYAAAQTAGALAEAYKGGTDAKMLKDAAAALEKDPLYAVGKEFQALKKSTPAQRADPRFAGLIERFLKKNPTGFYADQAKDLLPTK